MEFRESEERYLIAFALAAFLATLLALPMLAVTAQATHWIRHGSFLSIGEALASLRSQVPTALAVVGGTVTYTIAQEAILLVGRWRVDNPTPVTLLFALIPLSVLMGWMCQISDNLGSLGRVQLGGGVGFLVPILLFYSAISSPLVVPSILLRFAMGRTRGVAAPLIFLAGLVLHGLIWEAAVRMGSLRLDLRLHRYVFLFAASGFLAGGLSQLLTSSRTEIDPEPLPDTPKSVPKDDNYPREAAHAWMRLWSVYNAVLLGEAMIAMGYLFHLIRKASHVDNRVVDGTATVALIFAVAANLCFLLGPLIDKFLYKDTGVRLGRGRYVLFALGLLAGMVVIFESALFVCRSGLIR